MVGLRQQRTGLIVRLPDLRSIKWGQKGDGEV